MEYRSHSTAAAAGDASETHASATTASRGGAPAIGLVLTRIMLAEDRGTPRPAGRARSCSGTRQYGDTADGGFGPRRPAGLVGERGNPPLAVHPAELEHLVHRRLAGSG